MKKQGQFYLFLLILAVALFTGRPSRATVTSVILTPPNPTILSTGQPYYLAGKQYEFRVQVIDPLDTDRTHYTYVEIDIPLSVAQTLTVRWDAPAAANGSGSFSYTSGNAGSSIVPPAIIGTTVTGTSNLDLRFRITFAWDIPANAYSTPVGRTFTVRTKCDTAALVTITQNLTYGFCNRVRIFGMAQDGDMADGFINPYYSAGNFNITGTLVYDVTGATASDAVTSAIGTITLGEDFTNDGTIDFITASTDITNDSAVNISVPYTYFNTHVLGQRYWRCRVGGLTPSAVNLTTQNSLSFTCDRVLVTGMTINQGGGRDDGATNTHWRSRLVSGTLFTINARMHNAGGGMIGNTTFTINFNGGVSFDVTIPNGATGASVIIPFGSTPDPGLENTASYTYYVTRITGSNYGNQGNGSTPGSQILDTVNYPSGLYYTAQNVWWENTDPPSTGTPAITIQQVLLSATTLTVKWTPLNLATTDGDFYEYIVYVREAGSGQPFRRWSGADDATLRGFANNWPVTPGVNHFEGGTSWKYTTVTNLKIFTQYEYYVSAVDLFGNEITEANGGPLVGALRIVQTQPYSIAATVSDGIVTYNDFLVLDPYTSTPNRFVRESAVRVSLFIVAAETLPETVRVWYTTGPPGAGTPIVDTALNIINAGAFPPNTLFSASTQRVTPNEWAAYLPTTCPIIVNGNQIRFIVETIKDGISAFSDSTIEILPTAPNPNNGEWSFVITSVPKFTPWPTRILNNVITDKNPVAYPAYYLTDDAYVTIRAYDIKGRPIAILLDHALRKGGQNIKEEGWAGVNKGSNKVGVGLYYIHIKALRLSDGKVILNSFQKVVMAR